MRLIIKTCVILHNLIIDYEIEKGLDTSYISREQYQPLHPFEIIELTDEERADTLSLIEIIIFTRYNQIIFIVGYNMIL